MPSVPHKHPDARTREEALRIFYRMLDLDNAHIEDAVGAAIASVAASYEAEVARLREALAQIAERDWVENALDPQWAAAVAREALKAGGGETES